MPPTPRVAVKASLPVAPPPQPAPPAEVERVDDEEKEERLYFIIEQLAAHKPEATILRGVMRTFAVPKDQARLDYQDARDKLREKLDDEGTIDAVAYGALARINVLQDDFFAMARAPIREKIREVPAPLPDDPMASYDPDGPGAIFRNLTPGEYSSEIGARVAAGKLALQLNETLVRIAGRRSTRWADRPQNVIVQTGNGQISAEDKEFLRSIGVLK